MGSIPSTSRSVVTFRPLDRTGHRAICLLADEELADRIRAGRAHSRHSPSPATPEAIRNRSGLGGLEVYAGAPLETQSSQLFGALVRAIGHLDRETLALLSLDGRNRLLGNHHVALGSEAKLGSSYRALLELALGDGAHGVIIAHNHPSGAAFPSAADRIATRGLAAVLRAVDIKLLDHVIVTRNEAFSMSLGGMI